MNGVSLAVQNSLLGYIQQLTTPSCWWQWNVTLAQNKWLCCCLRSKSGVFHRVLTTGVRIRQDSNFNACIVSDGNFFPSAIEPHTTTKQVARIATTTMAFICWTQRPWFCPMFSFLDCRPLHTRSLLNASAIFSPMDLWQLWCFY